MSLSRLCKRLLLPILLVLCVRCVPAAGDDSQTSTSLLARLQHGGLVIYFRHAPKDDSVPDTDRTNLANCATQAPLSDEGRNMAGRIGEAFRSLAIPVDDVYTSEYCRCIETAKIAFDKATPTRELTSYFEQPEATKGERLAAFRIMLRTAPGAGTNTVLVSHKDLIEDATGEKVAEGEAAIFDPASGAPIAHVKAGEWAALAPTNPPDAKRDCFAGAYYRKAVTSVDRWDGIEGVITLPEPRFDPARFDETRARFLDNPSVYMGGRCGEQEIDCGLTWAPIRLEDGSTTKEGRAFRPFWRNAKWFNGPLDPEYCFHPGDRVRMRCQVIAPGKLEMELRVLSRNPDKPGIKYPGSAFTIVFDAPGFSPGALQEFKRVNAIDQVANEGKPVQPTETVINGAAWADVILFNAGARIPFTADRYTDMRCPTTQNVQVEPDSADPSGERITIRGGASPR